MSQKNQLPKRSEIAKSDQWRIQDLYANESEWEKEYKETERGLDDYQKFQGGLAKSAKVLFEALQERDRIQMLLERLYVYANQRYHEDTGNSVYQQLSGRAQNLMVKAQGTFLFGA